MSDVHSSSSGARGRAAGGAAVPGSSDLFGPRPASIGEIWRDKMAKAMRQPYLLALMIGSGLLSAASFFTTFDGMLHFMPVWAVTFCIVFAIQALLFVASWRIGFALADREGAPFFSAFVFLICLSTSVFFSWVSLFETINDADTQERTRTTRMRRAAEETIVETQSRAAEARTAKAETLLADPAYADFSERAEAVGRAALNARAAIDAARDAEAQRLAARLQEMEAERDRLVKAEAAAGVRTGAAKREIERLEQGRVALMERIADLRGQAALAQEAVVRKEGEMKAEEHGGAAGAGKGRGKIWRGLRDERAILQAELETKETLLAGAETDLAEADAKIEDLRAEIAASEAGGASAEMALAEARLSEMKERIGAAQAGERSDVSGVVAAMGADLARFENAFALSSFDQAAARCESVLASLKAEKSVADSAAGLSCDREALAAPLGALRRADAALEALAARCAPGGAEAKVVSELSFKQALAYGRDCAALSGLPAADLKDLRGRIDRLVLEEDAKASQFVKTINAFKDGDKLSYFALAIALFIDLLVLLSGLIGAVSVTSEMGRAFGRGFSKRDIEDARRALSIKSDDPFAIARAILEAVEPTGEAARREAAFKGMVPLASVPADLKGGVRQFLLMQCEKRIAKQRPAAPGSEAAFLVQERVLAALRAYIEETQLARQERAERVSGQPWGDDYGFMVEHLGGKDRRQTVLELLFRALRPAPRSWLSLLGARADALLTWDVAKAEIASAGGERRAAAEPGKASPAGVEDLRRLAFALYRRGLARPLPSATGKPELPGYCVTGRGLALLERILQADAEAERALLEPLQQPERIEETPKAALPAPEAAAAPEPAAPVAEAPPAAPPALAEPAAATPPSGDNVVRLHGGPKPPAETPPAPAATAEPRNPVEALRVLVENPEQWLRNEYLPGLARVARARGDEASSRSGARKSTDRPVSA